MIKILGKQIFETHDTFCSINNDYSNCFVVWKYDSMKQEKLQMVKKRIIQVVHRATQLVHSNTFLLYRGTQQTFALNASQYLDLADIFFFIKKPMARW